MLLAALLPLAIAMGVALWHSSQQTHQLAIDKAHGHLSAASEKFSGYFSARSAEITAYSETPLIKGMDFTLISPFLTGELQRHNGIYEKFILATPVGHFYNTAGSGNPAYNGLRSFDDNDPGARLKTIEQRDYWQATVGKNSHRKNISYISDPMISYTTGAKQVVVASTIISENNKVAGMIGGALPWDSFQGLLARTFDEIRSELKWDAKFLLVSHSGTYWHHWDRNKIVHFATDSNGAPLLNEIGEKKIIKSSILEEPDSMLSGAGRKMIAGDRGHTPFKDKVLQEPHTLIYAPLHTSNYSIAMAIPDAQLMAPVATLRTFFYYAFVLAILFVISVSWLFSTRLTTPITALIAATREVQLGKRDNIKLIAGNDEIAALARSYNSVVSDLIDKSSHLKQSEERFSLAMMGSNDGLCDWNLKTDQHFFSPRCKIILGARADSPDITLESWFSHIHPGERKKIEDRLQDFISGRRSTYEQEYRIQHQDGSDRHILSRAFAIRDPETHRAVRIVSTIMDISERIQHQQEIERLNSQLEQRINERTRSLVASNRHLMKEIKDRKEIESTLQHHRILLQKSESLAHVGAWEFNVNNLNLYWTEETYRMHELPRASQIDLDTSINFFEKEHRYLIQDAIQQAIHHGKAFDLELPLITAKANRIWVRTIGEATIEDDKVTHVTGSLQDISELKQLDQMKNDFVSTVSHELRTPLTSIHGSIKLLLNNVVCEIPPGAKSMLDIAEQNSQRLLTLINDLLDIEKISSGKMNFEFKQHSLTTLIKESIKLNQTYADRFGVQVTLQQPMPDCTVMVDNTRFLQVMSNLISNAAKFSPMEGEIIISVETPRENGIRISVQDFGNGIPDEFKDKIFARFSQADGSATRKTGGTGLGLNISRAIVEKMRGTINFKSQRGEGSIFFFELPTASAYESEVQNLAADAEPTLPT